VSRGLVAFDKEVKILDAHLAVRPFLIGNDVTLADFSVAAPLFYAERAGLPATPYANVQAWLARVSTLPCWGETAPQPVAAAA
jgi:glutathione S-transferase